MNSEELSEFINRHTAGASVFPPESANLSGTKQRGRALRMVRNEPCSHDLFGASIYPILRPYRHDRVAGTMQHVFAAHAGRVAVPGRVSIGSGEPSICSKFILFKP